MTQTTSNPDRPPRGAAPKSVSAARLRAVAVLAGVAAAVTAAQALSVAFTGEELCVGQGCAIVGRLTRLPPSLFNLVGTAVFAAVGVLALFVRRKGSGAAVLHAVLTACLAAEGVLFAYQWHVARAWCTYCLVVLAFVIALNLLLGVRGLLYGAGAFAATATIFSLLTFVPAHASLDQGTAAVRPGSGPNELYLIFSEDCPHCRAVLDAIDDAEACTVRFNPIAPIPSTLLPNLQVGPFDPTVNVAAARLLGLETIPIVVAREAGGLRAVSGEEAILRYLRQRCVAEPAENPLLEPSNEIPRLLPGDDGCGLQVDCD